LIDIAVGFVGDALPVAVDINAAEAGGSHRVMAQVPDVVEHALDEVKRAALSLKG
jgi:hypothetical protein